jgi:hypothetical protein
MEVMYMIEIGEAVLPEPISICNPGGEGESHLTGMRSSVDLIASPLVVFPLESTLASMSAL